MSNIVELNSTTTSDLVKVNNISLGDIININGISSSFDWAGFTGDDFTGTDGDLPNAAIWVQAETANKDATIQSNKLNFVGTSGEKCNNLGKFNLSGDFDVQVDFSDLSIGTPSSATLYAAQMLVYEATTDTHLGQISRARTYLGVDNIISLGEVIAADFFASSETEGKLRMTRVSGVIKVWHWHAGNARWEYDGGTEGWTVHAGNTNNVYITLNFNCGTGGTLTANMDNFTINSGTVVPPHDWADFTGDDFTGDDGYAPNLAFWKTTDISNVLQIVSNKLEFDATAISSPQIDALVQSKFQFSGDFDIQLDFTCPTFTEPPGTHYCPLIYIYGVDSETYKGYIGRGRSSSKDQYWSNGTDVGGAQAGPADASGQLRFTRVSGVLKVFYWDNGQWEWDGDSDGRTVDSSFSTDMYFSVYWEQESGEDVAGTIDNVVINSGTVVPPYDWAGFTGDDFTGVDGTDPNPIVWTLTQNDGGYASIVSNDWHYDSGGGDNNYQTVLKSRFTLSGDFQIKVSFANLVWDAPTDAGCYFPIFQLFTSAPAEVARISRLYTSGGTDGFSSQGNAAGSETYAEAGSSGVLRLIRTSGSITCSQWDAVAERWEWNGSAGTRSIGNSSADLSIQLFLEQENNSQVVGDILGVEIVSGTVVPP
ncbi:MAG TPA: hypothetical protein VMW20_04680 [Candidatus Nanoarchaeia archaeon]|nr:hypothetical protein [Candidatus Nanoarchaeia archaeon]